MFAAVIRSIEPPPLTMTDIVMLLSGPLFVAIWIWVITTWKATRLDRALEASILAARAAGQTKKPVTLSPEFGRAVYELHKLDDEKK